MKTATGILIVSLLAIESFAVDFLLVRDGRNGLVRDSDPFAYESRVARLNGAESITDETGTYCLYEGVKYYDVDAEAEAQAALPTVFETGIAVLDADGHHMEFVPVADGEPPLAIQISDSPLDKATRDAKVAAKLAELAAAKAERKALKDRELDDLKAAIASAKNHKELGAAVVKWIEATEPATVEDSK